MIKINAQLVTPTLNNQNEELVKRITKYNDSISTIQQRNNDAKIKLDQELEEIRVNKVKITDSINELNQTSLLLKNQISQFDSDSKKVEVYKKLIGLNYLSLDSPKNAKTLSAANRHLKKLKGISESGIYIYLQNEHETEISVIVFFEKKSSNFMEFVLDEKHSKKIISNTNLEWLSIGDSLLYDFLGLNNLYFDLIDQARKTNSKTDDFNTIIANLEAKELYLLARIKREETSFYAKKKYFETEIRKIEEIINSLFQSQVNYSIYNTKKLNGVEIVTIPLTVFEFRNGKPIQQARTPTEWNKFIENKIPAYSFDDFDEGNISRGLNYNIYAILDSNGLAPYGFHIFNFLDYNKIRDLQAFSGIDITCPSCKGSGIRKSLVCCTYCISWTKEHRLNYKCPKCENKIILGEKNVPCAKVRKDYGSSFGFLGLLSTDVISISQRLSSVNSINKRIANGYEEIGFNLKGEFKIPVVEFTSAGISSSSKGFITASTHDITIDEDFKVIICKNLTDNTAVKIEGNKIGDLFWAKDLLNKVTFNNGDSIKEIKDPIDWELAIRKGIPAYCRYDDANSGPIIYNIHAYTDSRGLIPKGWRVPNEMDFLNLELADQDLEALYKLSLTGRRRNSGEFEVFNSNIDMNCGNSRMYAPKSYLLSEFARREKLLLDACLEYQSGFIVIVAEAPSY
jgi:predicted  nucleic acid-binding Zn-ribbon protein